MYAPFRNVRATWWLLAVASMIVGCHLESTGELAETRQSIQGGMLESGFSNVVGIVVFDQGPSVCSGSLIAPNLVLTARHCVAKHDPFLASCSGDQFGATRSVGSFLVTTTVSGIANAINTGHFPSVDNVSWFGVARVVTPTENNVCGSDYSVLELTANVPAVCPLIPRVDLPVHLFEDYSAIGFGSTSEVGGGTGIRRRATRLNVECPGACAGRGATEWMGGTADARGACPGDSGGPALDAQNRVIGIVSRGPTCNHIVYGSVMADVPWLKARALEAAADGQYPVPGWATGASTDINPCDGGAGEVREPDDGGADGCVDLTTTCLDTTGTGGFACVDTHSETGFPPNAPVCNSGADCPEGYRCRRESAQRSRCLQDCGRSRDAGVPAPEITGGPCLDPTTHCGRAAGTAVCLDDQNPNGFPSGAAACSAAAPCAANYACWSAGSNSRCLQYCTLSDAGVAELDAGMGGEAITLPHASFSLSPSGGGCSSAFDGGLAAGSLGLVALWRRRRTR